MRLVLVKENVFVDFEVPVKPFASEEYYYGSPVKSLCFFSNNSHSTACVVSTHLDTLVGDGLRVGFMYS